MAKVYNLYVGIATGNAETEQWNGHFSKCPKELRDYCVHGECRYIQDQETPSCRCLHGYTGSRCEYVVLDWRKAEKQQIIISCVIAVLIFLILLIVFIFIYSRYGWKWCCRHQRSRTEEPSNGTEKLSMMDTNATHTDLKLDPTEPTHSNPV
ncbi:probetacellulin isoform X2 [Gouania willdenowi]|uniref:probetacellulin isoform X2 n=1 Tax=Gouania willdenowi TaxID=441366 RepID=UPI001056145B|nr:probetacellulin-like isoform X2 [Gouania willdenowi]